MQQSVSYTVYSVRNKSVPGEIVDAAPDDLALLKRVVDNAKLYFKDPQRFDQVIQETMEDEA